MHKMVLLRHGESTWNKENRFTGWTDVDLSDTGREEAARAAQLLKQERFVFDVAYTSVLKRAIRTLWIVLDGIDQMWLPVHRHWRLNERHYGGLTGLRRDDTIAQFGEDQVWKWRRGFDSRPPLMDATDPRAPFREARYHDIPQQLLPLGESLKDTVERVRVYWNEAIVPVLKQGKNVIICTHGNSQRALVKLLEDMPDDEVASFDVPNGVPLIYKLDADLRVLDRHSMQIAEATVSAIL